ncbi:hypothetical protein [Acrocarpospora corrugata]|nr:hypothetical protein [Acrocarpospora corrugata]
MIVTILRRRSSGAVRRATFWWVLFKNPSSITFGVHAVCTPGT